MKLKFSMQTDLKHINTILKYCHAPVITDVDVLHLKEATLYKPVLKTKTATVFFLKTLFQFYTY